MRLARAEDSDFDWLAGHSSPRDGWRVAPELSPPEVLAIVRTLPANWLMIVDQEVVGIIGVKDWGNDRKFPEIGYGTAASRRGCGFAKQAVALLIEELEASGVKGVCAETSVENPASQKVLAANGFREIGRRTDDEDGPLICWRRIAPATDHAA